MICSKCSKYPYDHNKCEHPNTCPCQHKDVPDDHFIREIKEPGR